MEFVFGWELSRGESEVWKVAIAGAAIALCSTWPLLTAYSGRLRRGLLILLATFSVWNYARWGQETMTERVDAYDLMHYYINAKYFDELGYLDLYPAVILVDHENQGPFYKEPPRYLAQDETGHNWQDIPHALARGQLVKQRFAPERWADFSHDVLYLQRSDRKAWGSGLWSEMIQDHGFNGTTVWTWLARPIASAVPVESVKALGYLDVGLLTAGLILAGWAWNLEAALFTLIFLMVSYSLRWPTVSWAFLRYDWVFALMAATAFLKRGHPWLAGIMAGWTATLRFFPALWMWGPFAKGVAGLTRRVVHRPLLALAASFLLTVAALQSGAALSVGAEQVRSHFVNMLDHNDPMQLSSRRIGLALALSYDGATLPKLIDVARKEKVEAQKPLRYGLSLAYLLFVGWALRRSEDDEAYGFGFLPFFLLTTASYYYYAARVTLLLVHAGRLDSPRHQVGLTLLLLMEAFSNWAESSLPGHRMFLIGWLAWLLTLYAVVQGAWLAWEAWEADRQERATAG